jgi:hypothetical protein
MRKLIFVAPDHFYRLLLGNYSLPAWQVEACKNIEDAMNWFEDSVAEVCVIFADQFDKLSLAHGIGMFRAMNPHSHLAVIAGSRDPQIILAQNSFGDCLSDGQPFALKGMEDLELALLKLFKLGAEGPVKRTLTTKQQVVLESIAQGLDNKEIAARSNVSVRAVETLISRTMTRLGLNEFAGQRGQTVAAQNYLNAR